MKSLDFQHLRAFADWLSDMLADARMQDIWTDGQKVVFEFYRHRNFWLLVDLHPQEPQIVFLTDLPPVPKRPKPVTLFLQSKAKNLYVKKFSTRLESGRVLFLELFSKNHSCQVELRLVPKAVNLIVSAEGKTVAWEKPRELPESKVEDLAEISVDDVWVQKLSESYLTRQSGVGSEGKLKSDPSKKLEAEIRKKESALEKISLELAKRDEIQYQKLGELLKYSSEVPAELAVFYDAKKSVAENRERAFQKAKDIVRKRLGTEERFRIIEKEILALRERLAKQDFEQKASVANQILQKSSSQARKKVLAAGFEVVIGKTGKDNLAILRQARAWDFWFHLKDYPGAHAILFRNKNQNVPDSALEEVSMWIIQESLGKKLSLKDLKFDVIVAECRFVKPVKGAQGLVTYQNQRNFTFRVKAG